MNSLKKWSNWKAILPLFLLYLLFSLVLFPKYQQEMNELAGQDILPLDLRITYQADEVMETLTILGEEGRAITKFVSGRVDMIYPLIYGLLLIMLILNLSQNLGDRKWEFLLLFPLLTVLFDYLENFSTLHFLAQFPNLKAQHILIASYFTSLKWLFILSSLLIIAVLGIIHLFSLIKEKQDDKQI